MPALALKALLGRRIAPSYFKPAGDNTADRVAMIEKAVDEGYNVIVMPGYAFGGAIVEAAPEFPEVKFIALDVAKGDLLEAGVAKAGESWVTGMRVPMAITSPTASDSPQGLSYMADTLYS